MKSIHNIYLLAIVISVLSGCSKDSSKGLFSNLAKVESFKLAQLTNGPSEERHDVDVLFVIDNSGSMKNASGRFPNIEIQKQLAESFQAFTQEYIKNPKQCARFAVLTTDAYLAGMTVPIDERGASWTYPADYARLNNAHHTGQSPAGRANPATPGIPQPVPGFVENPLPRSDFPIVSTCREDGTKLSAGELQQMAERFRLNIQVGIHGHKNESGMCSLKRFIEDSEKRSACAQYRQNLALAQKNKTAIPANTNQCFFRRNATAVIAFVANERDNVYRGSGSNPGIPEIPANNGAFACGNSTNRATEVSSALHQLVSEANAELKDSSGNVLLPASAFIPAHRILVGILSSNQYRSSTLPANDASYNEFTQKICALPEAPNSLVVVASAKGVKKSSAAPSAPVPLSQLNTFDHRALSLEYDLTSGAPLQAGCVGGGPAVTDAGDVSLANVAPEEAVKKFFDRLAVSLFQTTQVANYSCSFTLNKQAASKGDVTAKFVCPGGVSTVIPKDKFTVGDDLRTISLNCEYAQQFSPDCQVEFQFTPKDTL